MKCDIKYQGYKKAEDNCSAVLESDYMFYLSFENSLCNQYVTEKLWSRLKANVVPVVMGQANYTAITPPHSVISAMDFSEPRALAKHLKALMEDEAAYLSYFWWKDHYEVNTDIKSDAFCRLCQKLNDPSEPPKVRDNLSQWWKVGGKCKKKGVMPWAAYKKSPLVDNWLVNMIFGRDSI
jgi:alpha-1,3-fucosyltransferase